MYMKLSTINLKLASANDKKPTILATELKTTAERVLVQILHEGNMYTNSFHASRGGKTYYGDGWKWDFLPKIGKPIQCELIRVIPIDSENY